MILSVPLHRFTVPQRTMQQEWKALKFCYFLLLLDSVKLNKLLMVFCKTASFFWGYWGFAKRLYLEWFFFFYSSALSDKRWKKVEKKEKDAWQNERFCDTFFFACGALKQHASSALVFEIKGKGKKKKPKSKIFGKENKRRTKNRGKREV